MKHRHWLWNPDHYADHDEDWLAERRLRNARHPRHQHCAPNVQHFTLTDHAQLRAAQRGLSRADIEYVLRYGKLFHAGQAAIYFLRQVNIPPADRLIYDRLQGVAIIAARNRPCIITIWRNRRHGSRNIRRKQAQLWRQLVTEATALCLEHESHHEETDEEIDLHLNLD